MKTLITTLVAASLTTRLLAQGQVDFLNTSTTLISANSTAMPGANTQQFIFALFLAPSTTVSSPGQTIAFNDPRFQVACLYNTNHPTAVGRLVSFRNAVVDCGLMPGQTVDYVVRGWSANAGATWAEALANWNNGANMYIGSSTVGNDLVLGGAAIPTPGLFGSLPWQVGGFNMPTPCLGPCLMGPVYIYPAYSQTVNRGGIVTFTAGVYACPPRERYQWWFNGAAVPGATKATYQIASAQPANAGSYRVVVDNGCGYTLNGYALLTVLEPPLNQTAEIGARVHLSVHASGGQSLTYRWLFNGSPVFSGATNAALELTNVQPSQAGSYAVIVTNGSMVVTSSPAMLNVIAPIERRMVPGLGLTGDVGSSLQLEYTEAPGSVVSWGPLEIVVLSKSPQDYFDLSTPLAPQRFYRAWQTTIPTNPPSLNLNMIPALTLTGSIGDQIRVEAINQFGPTDAWFTLDTVTLTNTSQLYFDVTAPGQPARFYRLVPVP